MSVDISSLPPWKRELLEKRRKQEEEEKKRRDVEEDRLSKMPSWKRDILLKKQQQKNSLVFIGKHDMSPRSDVSSNGDIPSPRLGETTEYADREDELDKSVLNHSANSDMSIDSKPVEEHLIPIQQNPWVRTEKHWKRSKPHKPSYRQDHSDVNYFDQGRADLSNQFGYETDGDRAITNNDWDEDIFTEPEEEVQYGKGFVDKLRQKFSHLSLAKNKKRPHSIAVTNLSPKHSRSAENILDEVSKPIPRSISTSDDVDYFVKASILAPSKARSMDNILSDRPNQNEHFDDGYLRRSSGSGPKGISMGNDVSNHLPSDDVEGVSGISYKHGESSSLPIPPGVKIRSSEMHEEELPRANIVSATRTLFEGSGGSGHREGGPKWNEPVSQPQSGDHSSGIQYDSDHTDNVANGIRRDAHANHLDSAYRASDNVVSSNKQDDALQGLLSTGKVWYSSGTDAQDTSNQSFDKNQTERNGHLANDQQSVASRSPRTSVTADNQRANLAFQYGSRVHSSSSAHVDESSIITQKNQRNADLSSTFGQPTTRDSPGSSPDGSKKRRAPQPPSTSGASKLGGFIESETTFGSVGSDLAPSKSDRTKLHLDFQTSQQESSSQDATVSSPSYRDLYFSSSATKPESGLSAKLSGTQESVVDDDDEHLLSKSSVSSHSANHASRLSESTDSGIGSDGTEAHSNESGASSTASVPERHPSVPSTSNINRGPAAATENKRPTPPNSLPENKKSISINRQGETRRATPPSSINIAEVNNAKNRELSANGDSKKAKRAASQGGGPGSLLIRPASNLVTGAQTTNQFLQITRYNDVKTGSFEPAKRSGLVGDDVPITNIDDVLEDMPVTNIDDVGSSPDNSPRSNEIDSDTLRRQAAKKYEFVGAGVSLGRSLLIKSRTQKVSAVPARNARHDGQKKQFDVIVTTLTAHCHLHASHVRRQRHCMLFGLLYFHSLHT